MKSEAQRKLAAWDLTSAWVKNTARTTFGNILGAPEPRGDGELMATCWDATVGSPCADNVFETQRVFEQTFESVK